MPESASSAAFGINKMASSDAEDKLGLSDEEEVSFYSLLIIQIVKVWKKIPNSIMLIYLLTSAIIFQLDDSKVNSEEDQNDDSDYNTSKKRKRGKK